MEGNSVQQYPIEVKVFPEKGKYIIVATEEPFQDEAVYFGPFNSAKEALDWAKEEVVQKYYFAVPLRNPHPDSSSYDDYSTGG